MPIGRRAGARQSSPSDDEQPPAERRLLRAKHRVGLMSPDHKGRRWLTKAVKSYDGDHYTTVLHVLEGTPPRAYILENPDRGWCLMIDSEGNLIGHVDGGLYDPVRFKPARKSRCR